MDRSTPNTLVSCFRRQSNGVTPKLYDTELGPENGLPSPTTDVAYTLSGSSQTGLFETWIVFEFVSRVSLSRVTLHYYCTGTPPQLQLVDASGMATSTMTPSCGDAAHRQSLTFSIIQLVIILSVKRNGGCFYLTEVQFFNESTTPDPGTDFSAISTTPATTIYNTVFIQPASQTSDPSTITVCAQKLNTVQMPAATSTTQNITIPISISTAIAGWAIAAVAILVNGVQVIAMAAYCYKKRQRDTKQALDIPLRERNIQYEYNQAYEITQSSPSPHYKNMSLQHQAKDSIAPEPEYIIVMPQHQ